MDVWIGYLIGLFAGFAIGYGFATGRHTNTLTAEMNKLNNAYRVAYDQQQAVIEALIAERARLQQSEKPTLH